MVRSCGRRAGGGKRAGRAEGHNQKQELHTKVWGIKEIVVVVFSIASLLNPGSVGITEEAFTLDPISD